MEKNLKFIASRRSGLFELAEKDEASGRLKGKMQLTITDVNTKNDGSVDTLSAADDLSFLMMSATDIASLQSSAIKHMAPAPNTPDAETTKLVHIDLVDPSLPWRYTPEKRDANLMRPWMVLLVGTEKEIQVEAGVANVADEVFLKHDLSQSHLWAHVQSDDDKMEVGRIISPRGLDDRLLPQHQYIAVLVPAFNDEGKDMWTIVLPEVTRNFGKKGILPAFHSWKFMTDVSGDFETLATALKFPPAGDVGKAKLLYRRNVEKDNLHINQELEIRGAITSLQKEKEQQASIDATRADLDILNENLPNTIALPDYGSPWLSDPDSYAVGWPADLNDDPRYRGIAGLGLWMGIKAQENLVDAAVQQAGALREAGQRINNLAFGLISAERLWNRRIPTDQNERLRVLGPMMKRMLSTNGKVILDTITEKSPVVPAVFSSAAQRLIRDRSAQTRHITGSAGGISWVDTLDAANKAPEVPEYITEGVPHVDRISKEMGLPSMEQILELDFDMVKKIWYTIVEYTETYCEHYKNKRDGLSHEDLILFRNESVEAFINGVSDLLQSQLAEHRMRCEGRNIIDTIGSSNLLGEERYYAYLLDYDSYKNEFYNHLWKALCSCMSLDFCKNKMANNPLPHSETFCEELVQLIPPPTLPGKSPIDLLKLSDLIYNALDPRLRDAPARRRLCSRLQGVDCTQLVRPEYKVGLDFPTWELLKTYDLQWLLPGVNGLEKDTAVALQTNPAFIDAFMMGINTQFMSEMRWRDLAVDRTCTPLRMFWGQLNYGTQKREADIEPLAQWAELPNEPIGALSHQSIQPDDPTNKDGQRLVIVLRSDLFRRYPSTLVYLVKPAPEGEGNGPEAVENVDKLLKAPPQLEHDPSKRSERKYFGPTFVGVISPEITFFSFDVNPDNLDKYWLVLDEPPTELRFRNDESYDIHSSSAVFAQKTLDKPTRVAISGVSLQNAANHDNIPD